MNSASANRDCRSKTMSIATSFNWWTFKIRTNKNRYPISKLTATCLSNLWSLYSPPIISSSQHHSLPQMGWTLRPRRFCTKWARAGIGCFQSWLINNSWLLALHRLVPNYRVITKTEKPNPLKRNKRLLQYQKDKQILLSCVFLIRNRTIYSLFQIANTSLTALW